jgi:hypothetical protein
LHFGNGTATSPGIDIRVRNTPLGMPTKLAPLLCELHAHTTWSDGSLPTRELCDLYGRSGFDVLAVTDHTYVSPGSVDDRTFEAYLEEVEAEAERAPSTTSPAQSPEPARNGPTVRAWR